jgi:hypothetical protein
MEKSKVKGIVKKVFAHLKEDTRDYKKGIREDKQLKKVLKKSTGRGR